MGLAGYYRRFVEGFSKIAKPITTLQCKGVRYEWTKECNSASIELKRLLTSAPILRVSDMEKEATGMLALKLWSIECFELKTNHESLKHLFTQRDINVRQGDGVSCSTILETSSCRSC
jgi:hypothetical protein